MIRGVIKVPVQAERYTVQIRSQYGQENQFQLPIYNVGKPQCCKTNPNHNVSNCLELLYPTTLIPT